MVSAVSYINTRAGATTTTLYDIDPGTDNLYIQNTFNNGTLALEELLNLNIDGYF